MNILLVNAGRRHYPGAKGPRVTLPVGLLSIAASLREEGFSVAVYDALLDENARIRHDPAGFTHHGVEPDVLEARLHEARPALVGVSAPFTAQLEESLEAVKAAKAADPKAVTVLGGPPVSADGAAIVRDNPALDFAIAGEGEIALGLLARAVAAGSPVDDVPGLIFRRGGEIVSVPPRLIGDLDALPLPAYDLYDMERFFSLLAGGVTGRAKDGLSRSVSVITSRGCPFDCVFCSIHLHMGRRFRAHSPEYVLAHLRSLAERYAVTHVAFEDDNLTLDVARARAIFSGMAEGGPRLAWNTPNGVRADTLDEPLLRLMRESGCIGLTVAAESGSERVLRDIIGKRLDLRAVVAAASLARKAGIPLTAFFIIGLPGETMVEMRQTVEFALDLLRDHGATPSIFAATPLPGTRLHALAVSGGCLTRELTPRTLSAATQPISGEPILQTSEFNPESVKTLAREFDRRRAELLRLRDEQLKTAGEAPHA